MSDHELLEEARDHMIEGIGIIEGYADQHFSNELEREQALDSFCAWMRDFVRRSGSGSA